MWMTRDFPINPYSMVAADQSLASDQQLPVIVDSPAWVVPSSVDSFEGGISPWYGEYEKAFETLKQIGKGAFGHVNLAQRREDQMVVKLLNIFSVCQLKAVLYLGNSQIYT